MLINYVSKFNIGHINIYASLNTGISIMIERYRPPKFNEKQRINQFSTNAKTHHIKLNINIFLIPIFLKVCVALVILYCTVCGLQKRDRR